MTGSVQNMAKKSVREEMKLILSRMNVEEKILQSNRVTEKLIQHPKYLEASRVGIYLSLSDEIQTDNILKHIFEMGKMCFIPRYNSNSMEMIRIRAFEEKNTLPKTKWGIPQPLENDVCEEASQHGGLDLLVIPGRAFTKSGHRLGRGKGYYDKYLHNLQSNCNGQTLPYMIGLAFAQQIVDELPTTSHDIDLNEVIFDERYLPMKRNDTFVI